ncbi:hypothetical protein Hdeb2414_s0741g00941721 [Helianthus debilis subsp. tardiflorus]
MTRHYTFLIPSDLGLVLLCKPCHISSAIQQMLEALYPFMFFFFSGAFKLYYSFRRFYPEILPLFIHLSSRPFNIYARDYICSRSISSTLISDEHNKSYDYNTVATLLWQHISIWCKVPSIFTFTVRDLLELHNGVGLNGNARVAFQGIIIVGCWCIWRARNEVRFSNKSIRVEEVISNVKALGFLWFKSRFKCIDLSWDTWRDFVIM